VELEKKKLQPLTLKLIYKHAFLSETRPLPELEKKKDDEVSMSEPSTNASTKAEGESTN